VTPEQRPDRFLLPDIPAFNQEASDYCWAACLQMVCTAVRPYGPLSQIPDLIAATGIDQAGLATTAARVSPALQRFIFQRTGRQAVRRWWLPFVSTGALTTYIRDCIFIDGTPVVLLAASRRHAWVVVGFDGEDYLVHDPRATDPAALCATRATPHDLGIHRAIPLLDSYATLVIPGPLAPDRPRVTTQIANGDLRFAIPGPATHDGKSDIAWYSWDHRSATGSSFRSQRTDRAIDPIPTIALHLNSDFGLPLYNCSDTTRRVEVDLRLDREEPAAFCYRETGIVEVPPRGKATVPVRIDLDCLNRPFVAAAPDALRHRFIIRVTDEEGRWSEASVAFRIGRP